MPKADLSDGLRIHYTHAGAGPDVVLIHGLTGNLAVWHLQIVPLLWDHFRVTTYDLRGHGYSGMPPSGYDADHMAQDLVGLLDALGIERAALVGLSLGGKIALDVALAQPDRLWAVVGVAPALGGHDGGAYTEEHEARYDAAPDDGKLEAMLEIDLEVWAPLGADERIRQLWRTTPDANPLPESIEPLEPAGAPAKERLGELAVPTLVVTAAHDPAGFREIGPLVAREAPDARHVELDSDHYVTLREAELLSRTLLDFLAAAAPLT